MQLLFGPVPHKEASAFIAEKPVVSREVFDRMLPEVRARTFLISGLVPFDIAQKLRDRIADLPADADWEDVKQDVVAGLSPFMTNDADEVDATAAERKAELLLRTHGYQAYSAAQYNVLDRQRDVFPAWRYQTAQDDRVREAHAALEGVVVPANDPFWQTHFPPWDFNCRCSVVPLSDTDLAEIMTEDDARPLEERSILSADQLAKMNANGTLLRGPNVNVDVRSPRQKRDGDGYAWQPGDLRIPIATLRERYAPEVWGAFRTWAKATRIPDVNKTVWSWLGGSGEWPELADLSTVKKLGGSTGAVLVRDDEKRRFVMKRGAGAAHIESEVAADNAYALLRANVPKAKLYPGAEPTKLAQFIDGRTLGEVLKTATPEDAERVLAQVRRHFVADALLANYDVVGLDLDNVLVDKAGQVWRIDNGGALKFRAQGKLKDGFGATVTELQTLRDPKINPAAARVFAGITDAEIRQQTEEILKKRLDLLKVLPADVREVMAQRLDFLADSLEPQGGEAFAEAVKKSRIVGKVAKWDKLDIEDTQVLLWSETAANGERTTRAKLKLTEHGSAKIMERIASSLPRPTAAAVDNFWSSIEMAAKTVNKHAVDGAYNSATLAALGQTKAKLQAMAAAGVNAEGMKSHYLSIIGELERAIASKQGTARFVPWQMRPENGGGAKEFTVTRTQVDYLAKDTRRGHARERDQAEKIYTHDAYLIDLDGTKVRFVPFNEADGATEFKAPYALRGYVEVAHAGEATAASLQEIASHLGRIGLDTAPATDAYGELVYLRKGMQIRTDVFTPAKLRSADAILGDSKFSDPEKIAKLKAIVKREMGLDLPETPQPGYDWRGKANGFGEGWVRTERWDLPRSKVEQEMPGWTLGHHSNTPPDQLIDSILNGGGDFTATTERLRKGLAIRAGMSPQADLDSGGANYLFTRIYDARSAARQEGIHFKIGNLARQDAFTFDRDRYGNVKTSAAYKERAKTIDEMKAAADRSGNETIFKWGIPLLDEVDSVVVESKTMRTRVIDVFKNHGWETLPDGRTVADIVKMKGSR